MEDMRNGEATVVSFAKLISRLNPATDVHEVRTPASPRSPLSPMTALATGTDPAAPVTKRQSSSGSSKNLPWRRGGSKKKKEPWSETTEGTIWNEFSDAMDDVAKRYGANTTALKEFISSDEIMGFGAELVRNYGEHKSSGSYWIASDLFWSLQSVKQGDADPATWTAARPSKKDWVLADHLVRFTLQAENFRLVKDREDWNAWEWEFPLKVGFYLSMLRCFTIRDAKQKQLVKRLGHSKSDSKPLASKTSENSPKDQDRNMSA
ncbi:hypothetical protein F4778DRAFT_688229 [Xylariomycetidae sp. FL2044]|nr:hypothetical protein F4778DRAFT_688229 [Xylariomycetidae sp. FL2044]